MNMEGHGQVSRIARDINGSEICGTFLLLGGLFGVLRKGKANRLGTTDLFPTFESFLTGYQIFKTLSDLR
jgi:hypothetical protein